VTAVGTGLRRTEGPDKVTGAARYAVEYPGTDVAYVWPVQAPVARGTVRSLDTGAVLAMPGVLAVLWHGNAPRLAEVVDHELLIFQSDRVAYHGQFVAAVVADSLEAAKEAAARAAVRIDEQPHDTELRADRDDLYTPEKVNPNYESDTSQGDVDAELAASAVTVDVTYETAATHNNPMEPHASTAQWVGERLLVHDSNQGATGVAQTLATLFGLAEDRVQVVSAHVGGGFGAKGTARPNVVLAAMAARVVGRPVRLALARQHQFSVVGYRTPTIQRIRLGAGFLEMSWKLRIRARCPDEPQRQPLSSNFARAWAPIRARGSSPGPRRSTSAPRRRISLSARGAASGPRASSNTSRIR